MKESAAEGEGRSEMEFTNIETASDSLDSSFIFHIVNDILGFVLYMHRQIPSLLQDITLEFDELQSEYKDLETMALEPEMKAPLRRKHIARKREVKMGIRRMEKLMNTIANFKTALHLLITDIPGIERVTLVFGPSPLRPLHVYELCFSHGRIVCADFSRTRVADGVSKREAIRMLISNGAGSHRNSYAGPSKLFLLVKAPSSLNLPLHFLPKRDFRYNKKVVPFKLRFKCQTQHLDMDTQYDDTPTAEALLLDSISNNSVWFQCRHVIKGLACKGSSNEE